MSRLLLLFLVTVVSSCSPTSNSTVTESDKADSMHTTDNVTADTLMIYKINYDSSYTIFPKTFRAIELTQKEIDICEALLRQYIVGYNNKAKLRFEEMIKKYPNQSPNVLNFTIELREYGRQYMAVVADNGHKLVYINCFCNPILFGTRETELVQVDDGGNCYFNFKVDLTTKQLFDFKENGVA